MIADQGFGDAIQFGRFIPWALERCPDASLACGREIRSVLVQYGAVRTFERWEDVPTYETYMPLSGLPRLYGVDADNIPDRPAWLQADPERAVKWARRLDQLVSPGTKRIGLVWAGRPTHANDHRRSTRLQALAPLFDLAGATLISLQKGERQAETATYSGHAPLVNLGPELANWDDTMAVLAGLDAVVTVDTAVAHLAGAMSVKTFIMLPNASEWRWMLNRTDSPWYPSVRLFRQPAPGRWAVVAAEVAGALAA